MHWINRLNWVEGHFNDVNSSYPWTWYVLPLICIFFNFFLQCLIIFQICLISLVRFTLRYFILFEEIVTGIVFLTSLSVSLLLAYINAINFWILILHTATFLNSFMSPSSFLVDSLGYSIYSTIPSANNDSFTSSFPIWMPFIYSSCLISVAKTSSSMLNKRDESRHPCLVPELTWNACSFAHSVWYWQCICHIWPLLCLGMLSLFPLCWEFWSYMGAGFYQMLFLHPLIWSCDFILHLVYVVNHTHWFANVVPTLHSQNKYHLIMVYDLFDGLLYSIC